MSSERNEAASRVNVFQPPPKAINVSNMNSCLLLFPLRLLMMIMMMVVKRKMILMLTRIMYSLQNTFCVHTYLHSPDMEALEHSAERIFHLITIMVHLNAILNSLHRI